MDYINKTLLLSLEQDLYTLNESINNISTNGDLQSWLFPTKNYKFIDSFIKDNHKWKLNVKLILELIIDRRMKSNIQDLTQFGCMQLTTASIEKNLKQLVEKIMQYENENGELKDRVEMLTKQILNKNGTITLLEQENITLNDTLKKSETRQTITQNKINELQSENLEIYKEKENLKSLNYDLNSTLNVYRQVNSRLHEEKIILQENCGKTTSHIKHCIEEISELDKKLIILYRQHECFVEELNDMNRDLESLIKTFKKISKLHNEMETRIKISCGTIEDNARHITERIKTFQVKIMEKLFAMRLNAMSAPNTNTKIQVKGNPIEDITKQIEENNEKIKTLQNENVKLESILLKFKTIKK